MFGGQTYDVDYISFREGTHLTRVAYGAITSRSYHEGIVQLVMMDGSGHSVSEHIDRTVWRSLGTRGGGEFVGEF